MERISPGRFLYIVFLKEIWENAIKIFNFSKKYGIIV